MCWPSKCCGSPADNVTSVERHYQQQLALAQQVNSTQPQRALPVRNQPRPSTSSAEAAGLKVQQIEVNEQLRLTLSGDAHALLNGWWN